VQVPRSQIREKTNKFFYKKLVIIGTDKVAYVLIH
jgi:hypothetical protein